MLIQTKYEPGQVVSYNDYGVRYGLRQLTGKIISLQVRVYLNEPDVWYCIDGAWVREDSVNNEISPT